MRKDLTGNSALVAKDIEAICQLISQEQVAADRAEGALATFKAKRSEANEAAWQIGERIAALKDHWPGWKKRWKAFCREAFDKSTEWARQREQVAAAFTREETRGSRGIKPLLATLKKGRKAKKSDEGSWRLAWSGDTVQSPTPRWSHVATTLLQGDAEHVLKIFPENIFHGCLCDPPYGYGPESESAAWDRPSRALWKEVYRVLYPGTLLLASTGKSEEDIAADIEAAGFTLFAPFWWVFPDPDAKRKRDGYAFVDPYVVAGKVPLNGEPHAGWVLDPDVVQDDGIPNETRRNFGTADPRERLGAVFKDGFSGRKLPRFVAEEWMRGGGDEELRLEKGRHYGNRMFYCQARKQTEEKQGTSHPTLKPLKLTEHLAKLIRPPVADAHLLVPFSGAGSEIIGALRTGWPRVTGIEREAKYVDEAMARVVRFTGR
jgi:DNA modification methylase